MLRYLTTRDEHVQDQAGISEYAVWLIPSNRHVKTESMALNQQYE